MRIVKAKRRKSSYQLSHDRKAWDIMFEYGTLKDIPDNIALTKKAVEHWKDTKSFVGYANFKTLKEDDIISILSEVKRQKCRIAINRWGNVAYYSLPIERSFTHMTVNRHEEG